MTMASKSGGTMPEWTRVTDANEAVALLDTMHFWCVRRVNRTGGTPVMEVSITHAGSRVNAQRRTFVEATNAAMEKLHEKMWPAMRLVK
jgi:hypothetical protein